MRFQAPPLGLQPATEVVTLSDYRARHALYKQVHMMPSCPPLSYQTPPT